MRTELRSLQTHFPSNLMDFSSILTDYNNSPLVIYAGGTYLMSKGLLYPVKDANLQLISIEDMVELKQFIRNDSYIEFGSMCTLSDLLSKGRGALPKILIDNIESIGFRTIRDSITVGGTIASHLYNSLIATLSLLNATVEIFTVAKKKKKIKKMPIARIFDKDIPFFDMENTLITRVRVNVAYHKFSYFKSAGNSFYDEDAVSLACIGFDNNTYSLVYTINGRGYCMLSEIDDLISELNYPSHNYKDEIANITDILNVYLGQMSKVQEARVFSLTKNLIETINDGMLTTLYY